MALVARSSERVKLSGLTGANRVEEGWRATARGESQSGNRVSPKENREREELELWRASKRGRKSGEGGKENREEKGKEEIKGRRMGGGSGSCAAIQQIFTLRRRFPLEELSRDFAR